MKHLLALALLVVPSVIYSQSKMTVKVYGQTETGKYYGKLYIPKGGKWRIEGTPSKGTQISAYYGNLDGQDIYLIRLPKQDGGYWIDATGTDHALILRSNKADDIEVKAVTSTEDQEFLDDDYFYYDKGDAKKNRFVFTQTAITNSVLKESSTYNTRSMYVMANPAKYGLAFAKFDPEVTTKSLPANSLYVLAKKSASVRLNFIFKDDVDDPTAIEDILTDKRTDDAVYTLQGVRITKPESGRLYIKNGRKFIAK